MYAQNLAKSIEPAKALYALFRVFELVEQKRADGCPTQIEHLEQMRMLPPDQVTSSKYSYKHRGYRPITGALLDSLSTKLTPEDIATDSGWAIKATVLTTSNSARAAINYAAAINFGERTGQQVITWRRKMSLDLSEGIVNHLYTNGENPELISCFVKGGPGQCLDNQCGNVSLGVANGTHCVFHSLVWKDPEVSARMQAKINSSTSAVVHLDVPPDYIIVELPDHDTTEWPAHLNLCPASDDGTYETVLIPIGMSARNSGDTNSIRVADMELGYKAHGVDLAFALTVWKAQGQTLSHVIALLDSGPSSKNLTYECLYVIKSRVPSVDRIKCLGVADDPKSILKGLRPCPLAVRYRQDIGADGYWRNNAADQ
jgi:hypothetical protein